MSDQSAPKPLVTRAAEATAAGAANVWAAIVALAPAINNLVSSLAIPALCLLLGSGVTIGVQKATAPLSLPMALPDVPKAEPVKVEPMRILLEPLDGLKTRITQLEGKIDALTALAAERLPAPKVAPPKKTARVTR